MCHQEFQNIDWVVFFFIDLGFLFRAPLFPFFPALIVDSVCILPMCMRQEFDHIVIVNSFVFPCIPDTCHAASVQRFSLNMIGGCRCFILRSCGNQYCVVQYGVINIVSCTLSFLIFWITFGMNFHGYWRQLVAPFFRHVVLCNTLIEILHCKHL